MKKVKTHKFNGVTYDIDLDPDCAGYCDHPKQKGNPCLFVGTPLNTKKGLQDLLHEMLHASRWLTPNDKVRQTADDMGDLLWRLDFRKIVKPRKKS